MTDMDMPLPEPYGRITTHTLRDQQFFYRWPEPPYLDNAKECIDVHTAEAVRAIVAAEVAKERKRIAVLERLVIDAAYTLDKARIWNGMGWTYHPLHPIHYTPMRERLHNECDSIEAARAALEATR